MQVGKHAGTTHTLMRHLAWALALAGLTAGVAVLLCSDAPTGTLIGSAQTSIAYATLAGSPSHLLGTWVGAIDSPQTVPVLHLRVQESDGQLQGQLWSTRFPSTSYSVHIRQASGTSLRFSVDMPGEPVFRARFESGKDRFAGTMRRHRRTSTHRFVRSGSKHVAGIRRAATAHPDLSLSDGAGLSAAPSHGIAVSALHALLHKSNQTLSYGLVVSRRSELVGAWTPGGTPEMLEMMSFTKSVVALLVGRLVTEGTFDSADVPLARYIPE